MRRYATLLLLVSLMVSLAACGGAAAPTSTPAPSGGAIATATKPPATAARSGEGQIATVTTAPSVPTSTPLPPTATSKPAAAATALPAATPTVESLTLTSREEGLDKLTSYRMHWQMQWTSTDAGKTEKGNWAWVEEYSANPKALHWTWTFTDTTDPDLSTMESWQIGDTMYIVTTDADGANTCISVSSSDPSSQLQKGALFSPTALGTLSNARYVGTETVNSVRAKHYTYNEQSLSLQAIGKASGEVWVAVDGGYVVKETMRWEGSGTMFGESATSKGQGEWTWNLTDANKPITIKAPANCESKVSGLPVMPDAKDKSSFGDMLTYTTPSKASAVVDFYKKEMKAAGWTLDEEESYGDNMHNLTFSKQSQTAALTIVSDDKGTSVMINVEKE